MSYLTVRKGWSQVDPARHQAAAPLAGSRSPKLESHGDAEITRVYTRRMKIAQGIKLIEEREGQGKRAQQGDKVVYNCRLFLNKGEEVPLNARLSAEVPVDLVRIEGNSRFVDHTTTLGRRQTMAGIEYSLIGMKEGGYRKVRVSPHLAYRGQGIPGLIPQNAVLLVELWLRRIIADR